MKLFILFCLFISLNTLESDTMKTRKSIIKANNNPKNKLETIILRKTIDNRMTEKSFYYIFSDSISTLIFNYPKKYSSYLLSTGYIPHITLENVKNDKFIDLITKSHFVCNDTSRVLDILICDNSGECDIYKIDLIKDYDYLIEILIQVFDENALKSIKTFLRSDL